jgi:hypothetical protein
MNMLLTALVLWLSTNFGLPATNDHPRIEYAPAAKITSVRYGALHNRLTENGAVGQPGGREVISVYDRASKTIYLPEGWTGSTPAELSILVHELVHHLQEIGKFKFECPQVREKLAYEAQERWLQLFGRDLVSDFEIDPFTVLVVSSCMY